MISTEYIQFMWKLEWHFHRYSSFASQGGVLALAFLFPLFDYILKSLVLLLISKLRFSEHGYILMWDFEVAGVWVVHVLLDKYYSFYASLCCCYLFVVDFIIIIRCIILDACVICKSSHVGGGGSFRSRAGYDHHVTFDSGFAVVFCAPP